MRKFLTLASITAITCLVAMIQPALAREPNWKVIGNSEIRVSDLSSTKIRANDKKLYSNIRIIAIKNGVYLRKVTVRFGNGKEQIFVIDKLIDQGGQSPVMDLIGRRRHIKHVRVEYAARGDSGETAVIRLEGDTRPERRAPDKKHVLKSAGNTKLSTNQSTVRIDVNSGQGPFSEIAIKPNTNNVRINSVKVVFGNRQSDSVTLNQYVEAGGRSGIIEFDRPRNVKRVFVNIRPLRRLRTDGGTKVSKLFVLGAKKSNRRSFPGLPGGWLKIAKKIMSTRSGTETLRIDGKSKRFGKIILRALEGATYIKYVTVLYGNGQRDRIPVYNELLAPDQTRELKLQGNRRVSEIAITYIESGRNRRGKTQRPVIDVFAYTADAPKKQVHKDEWVLLGTRSAAMFNRDNDEFKVGKDKGRFTKIRVTAKKHDIRMYGMRIIYGNGNVEEVPLYGTLPDGQTSSAFDLKGRHRYIDAIAFQYRTRLNLGGPGQVQLWGLKRR